MLKEPTVTMFDSLDDICGKSIEELVESGKYDYHNPNLTSENFPIPIPNKKKSKRIPVLLHYDYDSGSVTRREKVVIDIKARGFDLPNEHEGIAFGAKYPNEMITNNAIYVLGKGYWIPATRTHHPRYTVLCLLTSGPTRRAELHQCDDNNPLHMWQCHFLAFKQVSKKNI